MAYLQQLRAEASPLLWVDLQARVCHFREGHQLWHRHAGCWHCSIELTLHKRSYSRKSSSDVPSSIPCPYKLHEGRPPVRKP